MFGGLSMLPAEGSADPFWDEPEKETGRMARILDILKRQPDASQIAFFIGKSNNDNFVAYKWNTQKGSIEPMWISTQNVPAERRDPLNLAEEMLYGVDMRVTSTGEWLVNLRAEAIAHRVMSLTLDDHDHPALIGSVNGRMCVLESAYVQMKRGLIPDVDYVRMYGKAVDDGSQQIEVVKAN